LLFLQDSSLVGAVVRRLLLNFMVRSNVPSNRATYSILYDGNQSSVLQRVGSAAGMITVDTFFLVIFMDSLKSNIHFG